MSESPEKTKARFERRLGAHKLAERLGILAGWSRSRVFRWYEHGFPKEAIVMSKLLDILPEEHWPLEAKQAKSAFK